MVLVASAFVPAAFASHAAEAAGGDAPDLPVPSIAPSLASSLDSVVITSSTLSANRRDNTARFEGNVVARGDGVVLYADSMTVHYAVSGGLERIEARGAVKLVKGLQVLTSNEAVYLASQKKITFTGQPRAVDQANVLTGTSIHYLLQQERLIVEGSKVFIHGPGGQSSGAANAVSEAH